MYRPSNKTMLIAGIGIVVVIALAMVCMRREKYNGVAPTWNFSSMDNSDEESPENKKCAGKKWNSQ